MKTLEPVWRNCGLGTTVFMYVTPKLAELWSDGFDLDLNKQKNHIIVLSEFKVQ